MDGDLVRFCCQPFNGKNATSSPTSTSFLDQTLHFCMRKETRSIHEHYHMSNSNFVCRRHTVKDMGPFLDSYVQFNLVVSNKICQEIMLEYSDYDSLEHGTARLGIAYIIILIDWPIKMC